MQDYKTAKARAQSEFYEKKSRFISYLAPVTSEKEAVAFLAEISARHREATHVVYAYSLLEGQIKRYSDDGEPSGTAGMPTLDVLLRKEIYNVAIATVRYFGGTLLGTGGLTRAYSKGASDAVAAAEIITRTFGDKLSITIPYSLYGKLSTYLNEQTVAVIQSDFGEKVSLTLFSPATFTQRLIEDLTELSFGSAQIIQKEQLFFDI